jgi:hypothetical protein
MFSYLDQCYLWNTSVHSRNQFHLPIPNITTLSTSSFHSKPLLSSMSSNWINNIHGPVLHHLKTEVTPVSASLLFLHRGLHYRSAQASISAIQAHLGAQKNRNLVVVLPQGLRQPQWPQFRGFAAVWTYFLRYHWVWEVQSVGGDVAVSVCHGSHVEDVFGGA